MTTKYIWGAYPSGYTLYGGFTALDIEASATIGGTGVVAWVSVEIVDSGTVIPVGAHAGITLVRGGGVDALSVLQGGRGYYGRHANPGSGGPGYEGGPGGVGVVVYGVATLTIAHSGLIEGGTGGTGGWGDPGGRGGVGGAGVDLAAHSRLTITSGEIIGGAGGAGGPYYTPASHPPASPAGSPYSSGPEGTGGAGLVIGAGAYAKNEGLIKGGPGFPVGAGIVLSGYGGVFKNLNTVVDAVETGLSTGCTVINGSRSRTARIEGLVDVEAGYDTVVNYGTIEGLSLTAASDVLKVEAECVFKSAVSGRGSTLDLASGVGTISDQSGYYVTVSGSMAPTTFTHFGTIEIAGGATFTFAGTNMIGGGGTTSLIDDGTLVVAGTITGTGALAVGEGTLTIGSGGRVNVAAATFAAGSTVNGAGTVTLTDATVAGLTVSGTTVINDAGTFDQTGTLILEQDAQGPRLVIANGGTYKLDGDVGVLRRASNTPVIVVDGLFVKSAGTGVSSVGVVVGDNGTIEVATGTLSFIAGMTGSGLMKIDAGTTLQFANTVVNTLTATFNGAGATLALSNASVFAATISGFTARDTIDLVDTAATSATLNDNDQLVITDGTTAVATLQLSGLYAHATFAAASDGHGGTAINVSGGIPTATTAHGFIAAMAGIGGRVASDQVPVLSLENALRSLLTVPRIALV